jgi:drug/metabolite transporter (DMT)-like permease
MLVAVLRLYLYPSNVSGHRSSRMYPYCFGPSPVVSESALKAGQAIIILSMVVLVYVSSGDYPKRWVERVSGLLFMGGLVVGVVSLAGALFPHPCIDRASIYLVCAVALADVCALGAVVLWALAHLLMSCRDAGGDDAIDV